MPYEPITNVDDVLALDSNEVMEGYRDGAENFPCGPNRSQSYFHGWRNGMRDGGHRGPDAADDALARSCAPNGIMDSRLLQAG